ncbi:MAG TPA: hypothetical protein VNO14_02200 [Blastocatellia bacterium]|nr:hypothetical protein [Blastocatellia bacterium]
MRSKTVIAPFILSLAVLPVAFALLMSLYGSASGDSVTLGIFGATVLVEAVALVQVVRVRRLFSRGDFGYLTWSLIMSFLIVRLIAEVRLTTINFQLVPRYSEGGSEALFFYIIVLRYLYTVSDILFIAALASTIRAYRSTGLKFELLARDYLYMLLVWVMPGLTYLFHDNLMYSNTAGADKYIVTFRLVTVSVGALIASLCLAVRRYVLQMGGGAVARVWTMVVMAGIARDASFLALALLSGRWRTSAAFTEQYLLWIFSCCWLMAALFQLEVLPRASREPVVSAAAESKAIG